MRPRFGRTGETDSEGAAAPTRELPDLDQLRTRVKDPRATIRPPLRRPASPAAGGVTSTGDLVFESVIAEGGMGIVRAATQTALGRRVATKTLRPGSDAAEVANLVAEASLSAALNHPNVVPVYDLKRAADGSPVLVMKLIDGQTWGALLRAGQPLDDAVRTLIQVCNGVRFAHARGVIHRDLKPDNVMVGHYGEVYIVDWGIAVRPGPTADFAGTLAYAAPEMLDREDITERTDVYLLGAMLFEVLAGRAPHHLANVDDMIASVLATPPPIPAEAPGELAELARWCLQAEPQARPESALRVKEALETFLEHRGSMALTEQATKLLDELRRLLAASNERTEHVIEVYAECRFGFRQALAIWPQNAAAQAGLGAAAKLVVLAALANGHVQTARILLNDLPTPDPALAEEVARALEESSARIASLQKIERRHDSAAGKRVRLMTVLAFGGFWSITPMLGMFLGVAGTRAEVVGGVPITFALLLLGVLGHLRARQIENEYEARIARVVIVACTLQIVFTVGAAWLAVDPATVTCLRFVYWAVVIAIAAAAVEPKILPAAAVFAIAALVSRDHPDLRFYVGTLANLTFSVNTALLWRSATERTKAR